MSLETWKANARTSQQNFSNLLNDRVWEKYSVNNEKKLLWNKIAFVVCGCKEKYSKEDKEIVDELVEKCLKYGGKCDFVYCAFLFVCAYQEKEEGIQVPIIRVMKEDGKVSENSYFIDHVGRVYNDWSNFLNENIFDQWWICVPKNGIYPFVEQVEIEFYDQTDRGQTLKNIDKISTISTVATSIGMLTGTIMSFTPLAPVGMAILTTSALVGTPGAVYGTGRSISRLVDRGQHDQSVSLTNSEARSCWISTVAGVLSFGNMASTTLLARSAAGGNIVTAGVRTFCTSLNVTTISMNGIGILNSVLEVASKKPDEITSLDILQLTTSIFFFTNSLVNFKTANAIVKDAQKATMDSMRNNLNDDRSKKNFDITLKNTQKRSGKMHGSADFIRGVKNIDNKQDFFQALGIDGNLKANFNRRGLVNIDNKLSIHPNEFMQIDQNQRVELLEHSQNLLNKKISLTKFNKNVQDIVKTSRTPNENQRKHAFENISSKLGSVVVNGIKLISNLKPDEIDQLDRVLQILGKAYNQKWIDVGIALANELGYKNVAEFCAAFEYVLRIIDAKIKANMEVNPNPTRPDNLKVEEYYLEQAYKRLIERIAELKSEFNQLKSKLEQTNDRDTTKLENKMAEDDYVFPTIDENNPQTVDQYFSIASEMTSNSVTPENSTFTEHSDLKFITYKDPKNGVVTIQFDNLADGKSVIATLKYDDRIVAINLYE